MSYKGVSPGPSGWNAKLLLPLLQDPTCLAGLARLVNDIRNAHLDIGAKDYLLAATLIAIPKSNGNLRPIAMGEFFYKIAAILSVKEVIGSATAMLAPTQLLNWG